MKRWIFCIFVCLLGFLVISNQKIMAQNCGNEDELCCFADEKYSCKDSSLVCVLRGSENVCVRKNDVDGNSVEGKCWCEGSNNCKIFNNFNYCDVSKGQKAYCVYAEEKKCGDDLIKQGSSPWNTCRCATPEQAINDKELSGYWKNYKEGTCVVGISQKGLNVKYYMDHNYCGSNKIPALYECWIGGAMVPICNCVDQGYSGKIGGCRPMSKRYIIEKNGDGKSIITQFLYGTNYKLYCEGNDKNNPTIQTSLGCIPITTKGFIAWLLPILFSIAGAVAFLIMVGGFISLSTSEGDPKKMQAAKDTITAAITGLLISLFAIFIVRFIIAYVLKIPGA